MSIEIGQQLAIDSLGKNDDILILMHKNPDGDTLGSGYALCAALRKAGKRINAWCDSLVPNRFEYLNQDYRDIDFSPKYLVSVDVADQMLLGEPYRNKVIDLAIDHHPTNTGFAQYLYCKPDSSSTCEIIAHIIDKMGIEMDPYIATCLYTGITTDTGCFRYTNTTSQSLRMAARMMDIGVESGMLNRQLFEIKTRGRVELEQLAMSGIEYSHRGKIAFMTITLDMLRMTQVDPADIEGITAMPRNIEGVEAGVTLRELDNGNYKISLRTVSVDAAQVCAAFGGGGHRRAAGFECSGSLFDIKVAIVNEIEKVL